MRKLFKAIAVSLAVIAALSVVGCKNDAPYAELELDKPSIQVKSFPGYNYVAWEPVDGAGALYVYRNDGTRIDNNSLAGANTNGANKGGWYIDTKIQNEQEYIYTVYAVVNDDSLADNVMTPGSTTSETLYNQILVAKGSKASAKTEAIVPPAGTRALDLIDYDSGDKKQYKLDADKIKVELINQRLWVSFPTKGYLGYEVVVMKGNEIELFQKLNQYNTIFGEVVTGQDIVDSVAQGDTIKSIKIIRQGAEAEKFTATQADFNKLIEAQKKANEEKEAKKMAKVIEGCEKSKEGIYYKIMEKGNGKKVGAGKHVYVEYKGYLVDGQIFDASAYFHPQGHEPLDFDTAGGQMIPGFDIMVQDMEYEEVRHTVLPPELAYGSRGIPQAGIPGNAYLCFDIKVLNK